MPPQQTNQISEPSLGAAELGFALASGEDDLPEQQAAGPPLASTRNVLRSLVGYWRAFLERRQRNRSRDSLRELSDRQLRDIGISSGDIECIAAHRTFEGLKDGTAHLWISRGVP
jgi:uncharacterized protein YjiS (DUF1127 family)